MRNASVFTTSWTTMSLLGLLLYGVVIWFSWGDRHYLRAPLPGVHERRRLSSRSIIATQNISIACLLGAVDLAFALVGIVSLLTPNPSAGKALTPTGAILLAGFFAAQVCLDSVAVVLLVSRSRLLAKVEADSEHMALLHAAAGLPDELRTPVTIYQKLEETETEQ